MGKKLERTNMCVSCGAACCRYVATQLDEPNEKRDYDNIRWYLMHKNVGVFVDREDDWYLEFNTECEHLNDDGLCDGYTDRPRICRDHGAEDADMMCEFEAEESPYKEYFSTAREFEAYLERKGVKWRFKKLAP